MARGKRALRQAGPRRLSAGCILLFARPPALEACSKGISDAAPVFQAAWRSIRSAAARLGIDLIVVGPAALRGARHVAQRGAGFAERLAHAFADVRALGYRAIVAVPGDVPGLDASRLREAFQRLGAGRTVLGPCPDGGVYLIGLRGPAGALLNGVRWRTGFVFGDLLRRDPGAALLAPLGDLDRWSDLETLASDALEPELNVLIRSIRRRRGGWGQPADAQRHSQLLGRAHVSRGPPLVAF